MLGEYFHVAGREGVGDGPLGWEEWVGTESTINLSMRLCLLAKSSAPFPFNCRVAGVLVPFTTG